MTRSGSGLGDPAFTSLAACLRAPSTPASNQAVTADTLVTRSRVLDDLLLGVIGGLLGACETVALLAHAQHAARTHMLGLKQSTRPGVAGLPVRRVDRLRFRVLAVLLEVVAVAEDRNGVHSDLV